jgi:hypothetical protein
MYTESQKKVYANMRSICPANKVRHLPDGTAIATKKVTGSELKKLIELVNASYQKEMMFNLHVVSSVYTKKTMIILS